MKIPFPILSIAFLWALLFSNASVGQSTEEFHQRLNYVDSLAKRQPDQAFLMATEIVELGKQQNWDTLVGVSQLIRGKILFQFGLFQPASEAFYEAEHIFEQENLISHLAQTHNALGELYYKIKSTEDALQRHESALKLYQTIDDASGVAETKSFIGGMYEKMGAYPKALAFQREALLLFEDIDHKEQLAFVHENVGSIYEDLEQYDSALVYFQKAYELNFEIGDSLRLISNLNNLGDVYRKTMEAERGLKYSLEAAQISARLGFLDQQKSAVVDISKAYAEMQDFSNAYKFLEQSRELSELVYSEESARQIAIQEAQNHLFTKNQQIKQLEQMRVIDARLKWALLFLVALLCVLGWVIFNRQKLKIRSNKNLLEQQKETLAVKERLISTEKQNRKLLELKMEAEEQAHSKALTAQTLHVIDKNQMLEDIQLRLRNILEEEPKEQKKKIRNLIKQIDYNFSHDTDWEDFKHSFEKVHQDFFRKIQQQSGGLTPAEMKLASLMRLNLNSKEIASTLGISMDSLRISRYRLRKKMKLEKGDSLQQFLLCI
ncbi:tetratricopeptide repeat protein [Algoriphagus halophytocola]|uniref:Tetratricopeptide repeat protein n=1 Tax=Algoriphagus halophytocola TaxID=2991499 RepID=A0ABY6MF75_9BACT|nr:tetratricopeptide repeat protein [Algoriphagus sp. TR-M5]UZD22446.1 tetratricopeptide repeat protein [Algoriphagus sp. TR-M5]